MQFDCGFRNTHIRHKRLRTVFYWMHIESDKKSMANTWLMDLCHIKHRKYFNRVNKRFMDRHDVYLQRNFDRKFLSELFFLSLHAMTDGGDLWLRGFWWLMRFMDKGGDRKQKIYKFMTDSVHVIRFIYFHTRMMVSTFKTLSLNSKLNCRFDQTPLKASDKVCENRKSKTLLINCPFPLNS